mgnify:CR=1 FL=1
MHIPLQEIESLKIFKQKHKEGQVHSTALPPPRPELSTAYGCSLHYIQLQPALHTVAASATYGCSLRYIRLQVDRVQDESTVICKNLFNPGTDMNLFLGMTVFTSYR